MNKEFKQEYKETYPDTVGELLEDFYLYEIENYITRRFGYDFKVITVLRK